MCIFYKCFWKQTSLQGQLTQVSGEECGLRTRQLKSSTHKITKWFVVFKQLLMEPSTRTSLGNDTDHHSTSLPQHKPSAQLSGGTPSPAVPPATTALTMSGKQPCDGNRGRAKTVTSCFTDSCLCEKRRTVIDVMDWCGASCLDLVGWTSLCHLWGSASRGSLDHEVWQWQSVTFATSI